MPFDLATALAAVPFPGPSPSTGQKRQYSDDLSREFTKAIGMSMRTHFPETTSGAGTGTNAASATGIKSVDVAFNIEGLFLGLGVSVKAVGMPEGGHGYTHNFKRLTEEWTLEAVNYHRYMPYAVIVGMLFLPADAVTDRRTISSLTTALDKFRPYRGRLDHRGDPDLLEEIYVGVYNTTGHQRGQVFFVAAEHKLTGQQVPPTAIRQSFEQVKDDLVLRFKARNPKLRVEGMP